MTEKRLTKERYMYILSKATELLTLSNNKHPFALAKILNVQIRLAPLVDNVPGFLENSIPNHSATIYINSLIDSYSQKIVCAHELGHLLLHNAEDSYQLFDADINAISEFEANLFVQLLLPQVFARTSTKDFKTISDFNKFVSSQIHFT